MPTRAIICKVDVPPHGGHHTRRERDRHGHRMRVTDAVFSVEKPEHVESANRIEIRLAGQDLLPRYSDI